MEGLLALPLFMLFFFFVAVVIALGGIVALWIFVFIPLIRWALRGAKESERRELERQRALRTGRNANPTQGRIPPKL